MFLAAVFMHEGLRSPVKTLAFSLAMAVMASVSQRRELQSLPAMS